MIRLNFALRRLPGLSRAEFQDYWREKHGPLVTGVSRALRMHRYVQTHTVEDPLVDALRAAHPGMEEPFDGIASVWFDSRDELIVATTSAEGRKAGALLLDDERRFIDLTRSPLWVSQEIAQIHPTTENSIVALPKSPWIKICCLLNPKPGIQSQTLDDELNDQLRATRGGPPPYAGLSETWLDRDDLAKGFAAFLEDEKHFIDFTYSSVWAAKELVFVGEGAC